jgi:hypothetical protein
MWRRKGAFITNDKGKVMEVDNGTDDESRYIIVKPKNGKIFQQFDILYVDQWKGEPKKGQYNKFFGLYVDRTFFVRTHMGSKRYLDFHITNANHREMAIKTRNG